jgi:hypothetical protein
MRTQDGNEGKVTMGILAEMNIKMGALVLQPSVREVFLAAIVQESKIDLQSQQEGSRFLRLSHLSIHRMTPFILTQSSSRQAIVFAGQWKRANLNFGNGGISPLILSICFAHCSIFFQVMAFL